ncbi:MAG: hypothetical protein QXW80_00720 [Candidatus Micrarchaeia archaeon]
MAQFVKLHKFSNISVSQLWSFTVAARKMPKGFYQLNPISFVKENDGEMFILGKDLENFSKSFSGPMSSNEVQNALIQNFFSEWLKSYESAKISLNDLNGLSFSSLSNDVLYKVYSIISTQSSDVGRMLFFSKILEAANKDAYLKLRDLLSNKSISYEEIFSLSLNLFKDDLFEEIGKRIYKNKKETLLLSPEEFYSSLYGGVFDEQEIEERKTNYIMVYDLEKDAPHIYSGEKARAMEASLLKS